MTALRLFLIVVIVVTASCSPAHQAPILDSPVPIVDSTGTVVGTADPHQIERLEAGDVDDVPVLKDGVPVGVFGPDGFRANDGQE